MTLSPEVRQCLFDAAALVRKGWTQNACARDENGVAVEPTGPCACRWCLFGAMLCSANDLIADDALRVMNDFVTTSAIYWQDDPVRTQAEVAAALEEAANG